MTTGTLQTATGICLSIARDPALVRTVRLVAAAVARRTTGDEEFVEEVRLAVGEACGLLVAAGANAPDDAPIEVRMSWEDRLRVTVRTADPVSVEDPVSGDIDGMEPWGLLRGLIDDLDVEQGSGAAGTVLTMSWPLD